MTAQKTLCMEKKKDITESWKIGYVIVRLCLPDMKEQCDMPSIGEPQHPEQNTFVDSSLPQFMLPSSLKPVKHCIVKGQYCQNCCPLQ